MKTGILAILAAMAALIGISAPAHAQSGPLRLEITEGVIEPMPIAIPTFVATSPAAQEAARNLTRVVTADLTGTGLFREIPANAFISQINDFSAPIRYTDWRTINAQALVTGSVAVSGNRLVVQFRIYDVFAGSELGTGLQFVSSPDGWRRVAHKVADAVYSRITGEQAYFDSRVVFVSESGPKSDRRKRLAIMDYDGQNVQYLTDSSAIVLNPRFSPAGDKVLYTSYESGVPRINVLDVGRIRSRALEQKAGTMSFGPRFSPDGSQVIFSLTEGGNTDIYTMGVNGGNIRRLTNGPSIETAPSYSPDGSQIVFESDRSGTQQLYVMPAGGGEARRISFGQGRYGTPVWSPRGDLIAFTKQSGGRFHIGIMSPDGNNEKLLTASFLDEGPTWAPNGRVIMFTRETKGADGRSQLYSIDITGRNLRPVPTPDGASDASWSPLQN